MRIFSSFKRKCIVACTLGIFSLACMVGGVRSAWTAQAESKADVQASVAALEAQFSEYCTQEGLAVEEAGYDAAVVKKFFAQEGVSAAFEALSGSLKAVNGNGKDVLTDEGVDAVLQIFRVDKATLLENGGTIGDANNDKLTGTFKATSSNGVSVGKVDESAGDFSIVVMGDQQSAVEYHSAYVSATYDYLVANAEAMNLKAFINVGDIVDDVDFLSWRQPTGNGNTNVVYNPGRMGNWKMQLDFAAKQSRKLLNANIPTAMCMGNHDYEDMAESYRVKDSFNEYFPLTEYQESAGWGGNREEDIEASYYYFEGNGTEYMILTLGCYPTDAMLAWANEVVAANANKKVIVATHAYMYGGSEDLREDGMHIWDSFVSRHENIFMVVCGHECTDSGEIIRRVDYGKNGNAVTQFMINPQNEEFGGSGIFSQLIFHADNTVDLVSYSPYCNDEYKKGYFMDENQFTFSLLPEKLTLSADISGTVNGKTVESDSHSAVFLSREEGLENTEVYEYYNVKQTLGGLIVGDEDDVGYVVYRMRAGDLARFTAMSITAQGEFLTPDGAYQVELSRDGIHYEYGMYNNVETGYFNCAYALDRMVVGVEELYVKVLLRDVEISKLHLDGDSVQTVFTKKNFLEQYTFDNDVPSYSFAAFTPSAYGATSAYYACLSNGILGSGASGRLSYKSNVVYQFDAGTEGRYFTDFSLDGVLCATSLYADAEEYDFDEADVGYLAKLYVRYNGEGEFKLLEVIDNDADLSYSISSGKYKEFWFNRSFADEFDKDGEGYRAKRIEIKIEYMGAGSSFAACGLKSVNFAGTYNKEIEVEESVEHQYLLNGGYFAKEGDKEPKKEGCKFAGWYLDEQLQNAADPSDYKNKAYTFYAKWERNLYYIHYVLNDGNNSSRNLTSISSSAEFVLADANKEGYVFLGWYDKNGTQYTEIVGKNLKEDLILYAQYAEGVEESGCASTVDGKALFAGSFVVLLGVLFLRKKSYGRL